MVKANLEVRKMGPDIPPPIRFEQKGDTLNTTWHAFDWLATTERSAKMDKTQSQGLELTDRGQINQMRLPHGWVEGNSDSAIAGNGTYLEYHPTANDNVNINFFFRGRAASPAASEKFHSLMEQTPHLLKPEELKGLKEILRDKADEDQFSVLSARTKVWNGKNVLVVEGRYRKLQEDTLAIYVDADGTGKFVQEIYYQAPKAEYNLYLKQAKNSLESIEWK